MSSVKIAGIFAKASFSTGTTVGFCTDETTHEQYRLGNSTDVHALWTQLLEVGIILFSVDIIQYSSVLAPPKQRKTLHRLTAIVDSSTLGLHSTIINLTMPKSKCDRIDLVC